MNTHDPAPTMTESTGLYRTSSRFRFLTLGALIMTFLLIWDVWQTWNGDAGAGARGGALLFLGISLGILAWGVHGTLTWVEVTEERLVRHAPFGADQTVEFRQLVNVEESGRGGGSLTLIYHPRYENGLLDLDDIRSLTLPALRNQEALLRMLEAQIPS